MLVGSLLVFGTPPSGLVLDAAKNLSQGLPSPGTPPVLAAQVSMASASVLISACGANPLEMVVGLDDGTLYAPPPGANKADCPRVMLARLLTVANALANPVL